MELKNYTTPKPGFLLNAWGGFWNDGLGASLLGTDSSYFWFDTEEERAEAVSLIQSLALAKKTTAVCYVNFDPREVDITKRTIAKMVFELPDGRRFPFTYDFGYGYADHTAMYCFEEGNYSCDCNISNFLMREYPDAGIEKLECGDTILLHDLEISYEP